MTALTERAAAAFMDQQTQREQETAEELERWQASVREAAAVTAAQILYDIRPPRVTRRPEITDLPEQAAPQTWTIRHPDQVADRWTATATIDGLRFEIQGSAGKRRLFLVEACEFCDDGQADRHAPITSLADLGYALHAKRNSDTSPWSCPSCEAAIRQLDPDPAPVGPAAWLGKARVDAEASEVSDSLTHALTSIAHSLLILAHHATGGEAA